MTTQATTVRRSKQGTWGLIGATAATLAVLGGALLWQGRPSSEVAAPDTTGTIATTMQDGTAPRGGLAELYRDQADAAAAERDARVTTIGGMAEFYAAQQAEAAATAELEGRIGGMAELYRYQGQSAGDVR